MATVLLAYDGRIGESNARALHKHHLVDQLRRRGYTLVSAEPEQDDRIESAPRTVAGMRTLLRVADAIYVRSAVRGWDLVLLELNARSTRRPVIVEINAPPEETLAYGAGYGKRSRVRMRRLVFHHLARRASALICVSHPLARFVRATYPVVPALHVVPNGGVVEAQPGSGLGDGCFRMLWAGDARRPWQAVDLAIDVTARLRTRVPGAELHLYGHPNPALPAAAPGVVVHGGIPHSQLRKRLRVMDVALCLYRTIPSIPAGFYWSPLKLFEAMGAAVPVVASAMGQMAEVVQDGASGFLVDHDPREMAERLCWLAADAPLKRAMGAAARQRVRDAYSWDHTGEKIDAVLRTVLA